MALTIAELTSYALERFDAAARDFRETPSAHNWTHLMRAALVHQQAHQLRRWERTLRVVATCADDPTRATWDETIVECACGRSIAAVLDNDGSTLAAAAPTLLAALKRAADLLARDSKHDDAWRQARDAITQATEGAA